MDKLLNDALANGRPPFSAGTLHLHDLLPLQELQGLLAEVIVCLRAEVPDALLQRHADWHEHDGYITSSLSINWSDLGNLVQSEQSLYEQRLGDDFVRIGIYDERGTFYLRIWVLEEDDDPEQYPGRWGSFDLSAAEPLLSKLGDALQRDRLIVSEAKTYFNERNAA